MAFQSDIKKALRGRLTDYTVEYPVDIAGEASSYTPVEGVLYLNPHFLPASPVQKELQGVATRDRFTGIYQIDVVMKKGTGMGDMEVHADQLQAYFGRGKSITYTNEALEEILVEVHKYYYGELNDKSTPWIFIPVYVQYQSDIWVG